MFINRYIKTGNMQAQYKKAPDRPSWGSVPESSCCESNRATHSATVPPSFFLLDAQQADGQMFDHIYI